MKMVVVVGQTTEIGAGDLMALGRTIANLISDAHRIMLVQERDRKQSNSSVSNHMDDLSPIQTAAQSTQVGATRRNNICELAVPVALRAAGVVSFTLSGLDGQVLALRTCARRSQPAGANVEVSSVSPFWIDVICERGAVPVFLNEGVDYDGNRRTLDTVQCATACAIGWDADALVILMQDEGVRDHSGAVVRWLDISRCNGSLPSHSGKDRILDNVNACGAALRAGVRRCRILPWSQITRLDDFFQARIDSGTEIILRSPELT